MTDCRVIPGVLAACSQLLSCVHIAALSHHLTRLFLSLPLVLPSTLLFASFSLLQCPLNPPSVSHVPVFLSVFPVYFQMSHSSPNTPLPPSFCPRSSSHAHSPAHHFHSHPLCSTGHPVLKHEPVTKEMGKRHTHTHTPHLSSL